MIFLPEEATLSSKSHFFEISIVLLVLAVAITVATVPGLLVDPKTAESALKEAGYTQIRLESPQVFAVNFSGCETGQSAKFDATAVNRNRQRVSLYVCVSWPLKGATIHRR